MLYTYLYDICRILEPLRRQGYAMLRMTSQERETNITQTNNNDNDNENNSNTNNNKSATTRDHLALLGRTCCYYYYYYYYYIVCVIHVYMHSYTHYIHTYIYIYKYIYYIHTYLVPGAPGAALGAEDPGEQRRAAGLDPIYIYKYNHIVIITI